MLIGVCQGSRRHSLRLVWGEQGQQVLREGGEGQEDNTEGK